MLIHSCQELQLHKSSRLLQIPDTAPAGEIHNKLCWCCVATQTPLNPCLAAGSHTMCLCSAAAMTQSKVGPNTNVSDSPLGYAVQLVG
jgi:hypothetical protein